MINRVRRLVAGGLAALPLTSLASGGSRKRQALADVSAFDAPFMPEQLSVGTPLRCTRDGGVIYACLGHRIIGMLPCSAGVAPKGVSIAELSRDEDGRLLIAVNVRVGDGLG